MTQREQTIVEMLKRYTEAQETGVKDGLGDGGGTPGMPKTWNRSYRELERCLKIMREERKSQYWHVCERYVRADVVTLTVPFRKTAKGPVPKLPAHTELVAGAVSAGDWSAKVRVRRWNPRVREEKVRRGVAWLSGAMRLEPFLPAEFAPEFEKVAA